MPDTVLVPPANLLFDEENPRLPEPITGQRDMLRTVAKDQDQKLLALARDIVTHGVNPAELPIVMASPTEPGRFVVLEGNRRLAALRGLENPDALVGALATDLLTDLRTLSQEYQGSPIDRVQCLQVRDREEAAHWIELRHTGENQGAGVVRWAASETARFRSRSAGEEPHLQALTFLQDRGVIGSAERQRVPTTSLRRLIGTPAVRDVLGIAIKRGQLQITADEAKVARALAHVVDDLASGRVKTKDIYTTDERAAYARDLPAGIRVGGQRSGNMPATGGSGGPKPPARPRRRSGARRANLIPKECHLNVTDNRVHDIEGELRDLRLNDYQNAVSVLFRVFLELSVDSYIERQGLGVSPKAKLSTKILKCVSDLETMGKLSEQQAKVPKTFSQNHSFLAPNVQNFHGYVHNQYIFPAPSDLRAHWDSLQPFVAAIWAP